ncbi:hypothetical protein ACFO3O_09895 [Dokdonia ponticola]|uniref:Uncharacterized protein n=1 Tax=Dokdonia ponticola TaxID=2041041 RepID=A0ABV9HY71_9FLAO
MTTKHISVLNLITVFTKGKAKITEALNAKLYCSEKHLHDYYCDREAS